MHRDIMPRMRHRIIDTFTGPFVLIEHDDGAIATTWLNGSEKNRLKNSKLDPRLQPDLAQRLKRFFAGDDVDFNDVPLPGDGFFHRCWNACRKIPRGQTRSYAELAKSAGSSGAARAAGQSMRNNALPIIVPCHRVIASGGNLHGFSGSCDADGGELAIKRKLLEMEGAISATRMLTPHLKNRKPQRRRGTKENKFSFAT